MTSPTAHARPRLLVVPLLGALLLAIFVRALLISGPQHAISASYTFGVAVDGNEVSQRRLRAGYRDGKIWFENGRRIYNEPFLYPLKQGMPNLVPLKRGLEFWPLLLVAANIPLNARCFVVDGPDRQLGMVEYAHGSGDTFEGAGGFKTKIAVMIVPLWSIFGFGIPASLACTRFLSFLKRKRVN